MEFTSDVSIPETIMREFSQNNSVEFVFISNNILYTQVLHPTNETTNYIYNLISKGNTQEFVIVNKLGEVLYESKPNTFNVTVDENYYITITKDEKIVVMHASNNTFITGSSKKNVNESFLHLVNNDVIDYDETFKNNQFTSKAR